MATFLHFLLHLLILVIFTYLYIDTGWKMVGKFAAEDSLLCLQKWRPYYNGSGELNFIKQTSI